MASSETTEEDTEQDFTYDSAVYYEEDDPKTAQILDIRARLESDRWELTLCDPYRDGDGTQMGRFEHSAKNSRHALVFLSPSLLERIKKKQANNAQFNVETFLCNILKRRDNTMKRKVMPVMFDASEGDVTPLILSGYTPFHPGEVGFWRKIYRTLSREPVPDAFMLQVSKKVQQVKHLQLEAVLDVAAKLGLPEEVVDSIKVEYAGSQARLRQVFYCWKAHLGAEATLEVVDDVIREATSMPVQEEQQQHSLVGLSSAEYSAPASQMVTQPSSACPSMQDPPPSSLPPDETPDIQTGSPGQRGPDTDSGVVVGANDTEDEELSEGLQTLNLNTQQSCDPGMGASGQSDDVPDFHSLPAMTQQEPEARKEPEKKKGVAGFFRSFSLKGTSSTKEKQKNPSLVGRLRRSLSRKKRPVAEME
ncbi:PREDICTED: uncharacterized protein LOC109473034 [Branchiostoma belcheri]|uniref:Uncharacterized protein LOC109473034 n=1 Tax=Branchiostoma belcheri TaxID=7741 RepID=A0A6P4YGT8_BRABE|nr:PREDICTED: uncharacterized protein LOC109473034 [Branchiostoma belcheri]